PRLLVQDRAAVGAADAVLVVGRLLGAGRPRAGRGFVARDGPAVHGRREDHHLDPAVLRLAGLGAVAGDRALVRVAGGDNAVAAHAVLHQLLRHADGAVGR